MYHQEPLFLHHLLDTLSGFHHPETGQGHILRTITNKQELVLYPEVEEYCKQKNKQTKL